MRHCEYWMSKQPLHELQCICDMCVLVCECLGDFGVGVSVCACIVCRASHAEFWIGHGRVHVMIMVCIHSRLMFACVCLVELLACCCLV